MFDSGPHHPAKGLIGIRLAYDLDSNAIVVIDSVGSGILMLHLDQLVDSPGLIEGVSQMLKAHAVKAQAEALEEKRRRDEFATTTGGGDPAR